MYRKTTLKIVYLLFFVFVIASVSYFLFRNYIAADVNVGENGDRRALDFGDEIGEKYVLVRFDNKPGEIIVKKDMRKYCNHQLSGFESSVKIDGILEIDGVRLIQISGPVGVHGRSRQYFRLNADLCPVPLAFVKDQLKVYTIYSDQPSFSQSDFDGDGSLDIAAEYRNYDLNPLVDGIREIYRFDKAAFEFEYLKSENYQQTSECPDCDKEIK